MLWTYVGQYQLDLDGAQGYIVGLCVSGLILHGAFQTKFLGILYHILSTFMLIRRSAGCFKCDFQIFGILGNYFIMVGHGIMVRTFTLISLLSVGLSLRYCYER